MEIKPYNKRLHARHRIALLINLKEQLCQSFQNLQGWDLKAIAPVVQGLDDNIEYEIKRYQLMDCK